jgi:chromosome segregation ATPase
MIVTADPLGDFNATSQILRYSALAREITVPRVPSVTSTILSGTTANKSHVTSGRTTPSSYTAEELEYAAQEIARLTEELDVMGLRLTDEESRRREMENAWKSAEERCALVEQEVREECWLEMERRMEEERRRWKGAWGEEADRNDEHLDKKLEILTRTIQVYEDPEPSAKERIEEMEGENEALRRKIDLLERELQNRSPTKKQRTLPAPRNFRIEDGDLENAVQGLSEMRLDDTPEALAKSKSAVKKQRCVRASYCYKESPDC